MTDTDDLDDDSGLYFGCPYCGMELSESWSACCGEAGHGCWINADTGEPVEK